MAGFDGMPNGAHGPLQIQKLHARVQRKVQPHPVLCRHRGQLRNGQHRGRFGVECMPQRPFHAGQIQQGGVVHQAWAFGHEVTQLVAKPAQGIVARGVCGNVGVGQCVEGVITHDQGQHFKVFAQGTPQSCAVGVLVDTELCDAAGAEQAGYHRTVLQHVVLKLALQALKGLRVVHAVHTTGADSSAPAWTLRAMSSSSSSSCSSGMLSSRSIIVGTLPQRRSV